MGNPATSVAGVGESNKSFGLFFLVLVCCCLGLFVCLFVLLFSLINCFCLEGFGPGRFFNFFVLVCVGVGLVW